MNGAPATPRSLKLGLGNWVSGPERFFGRTDEIARLRELLEDGESVALAAPRRAGKTSLMYEVGRNLPKDRFHCLHLDLEGASDAGEFFRELERAGRQFEPVRARILEFITQLAGPLGEIHSEQLGLKFEELFGSGWQHRAERFFAQLAGLPQRSIFFIDEVPLFFQRLLDAGAHGRTLIEEFLTLLRSVAQRHRGQLQFVITGSVGLVPMVQRLGLSAAINHYVQFELPPWEPSTICECLLALGAHYGIHFTSRAEEEAAKCLGVGIPYHVQVFFSELREHAQRKRVNSIFPDDVIEVYRQRMLGSHGVRHLSHLRERLGTVFVREHELSAAKAILSAATEPAPLPWPEVLRIAAEEGDLDAASVKQIVEILIHDGYLRRIGDELYTFVPGYMRDWWRQQCSPSDAVRQGPQGGASDGA